VQPATSEGGGRSLVLEERKEVGVRREGCNKRKTVKGRRREKVLR
jgi:hypothetical protein